MLNGILQNPRWAVSHLGNPIGLYHSHPVNALASLHPLLFVGGVHGDEPEGVALAENLLAALADTKPLKPWALITCLNPDGYSKNERVNGRGVDLNRNFPTRDWVANEPGQRYYSGPKPASENETAALVSLINNIKPRCIIHFHSWKPCIVFTGEEGRAYAKALSTEGYDAIEDIGYPTPGSLGQYGGVEKKIPVVCIEEEEGAAPDAVWQRFGTKLISLLDLDRQGL